MNHPCPAQALDAANATFPPRPALRRPPVLEDPADGGATAFALDPAAPAADAARAACDAWMGARAAEADAARCADALAGDALRTFREQDRLDAARARPAPRLFAALASRRANRGGAAGGAGLARAAAALRGATSAAPPPGAHTVPAAALARSRLGLALGAYAAAHADFLGLGGAASAARAADAAPRVEVLERAARRALERRGCGADCGPGASLDSCDWVDGCDARLAALEDAVVAAAAGAAPPPVAMAWGAPGDVDRGHAAAAAAVAVGATRVAATLAAAPPAPPAPEAPPTPRDEADALAALLAWIDGGLGGAAAVAVLWGGADAGGAWAAARDGFGGAVALSRDLRLTAAGAAALGDHAGCDVGGARDFVVEAAVFETAAAAAGAARARAARLAARPASGVVVVDRDAAYDLAAFAFNRHSVAVADFGDAAACKAAAARVAAALPGAARGGAPGGAAARRVLRRALVAGAAANAAWGFEALGDVVSPVAVWKSTSGTPRPANTSHLSISITSTSIRLILGRIDGSRRVLEAQPKNVRRIRTLTLESG